MRILLIEDEAIIALYVGMTLQEAGHEVIGPATRLNDCLPLVERTVPELALVDINLDRGGSGIDVARTLLERWGVMSIFVSAQYLQARENMDVAIGCLRKPFATRSLVESIEVADIIRHGAMPLRVPDGMDLFVNGAESHLH
jgi:DNA-binding response OmpR family regulator